MASEQQNQQTTKTISESTPAEDFVQLIKDDVENIQDDDLRDGNFQKYGTQMQKVLESIIFKEPRTASIEDLVKALKAYRDESGFYNPYDYNDWIKTIKTKLFEKNLLEIWEKVIVENRLGLLWARDCDFFDDIDDKRPYQFYKTVPGQGGSNDDDKSHDDIKRMKLNEDIATGGGSGSGSGGSGSKSSSTGDDKVTSADHYAKLIKERVEEIDPELECDKLIIFDKLSDQIREILTNSLLNSTEVDYAKIARDLKIYRDEAGFYNPFDYNDWIQEIKLKLKERNMIDCWEKVIVKNQLGLLWARDCDFFDDMDDPEPKKFYDINIVTQKESSNHITKVGMDTPAQDYRTLVKREVEELHPDREDERMDIFDDLSKQMQNVIEKLLFENNDKPDFEKAAESLKVYRDEAGFYNPYDYNDWIKEIKTKLIEKKYMDFWQNVIVKDQLGLLWARDCDFFDDMDDKEPENFYKI